MHSLPPGSSPLSRGILFEVGFYGADGRIIPALAGNTAQHPQYHHPSPDHPRSRGEYWLRLDPFLVLAGSSPLSRGILGKRGRNLRTERIIPALAGNTAWSALVKVISPDHPRSRGEYKVWEAVGQTLDGSSPLSRGIRTPRRRGPSPTRIIPALAGNTCQLGCCVHWGGIIPALAGNTRSGSRIRSPVRDHPRSRGEYRRLWRL